MSGNEMNKQIASEVVGMMVEFGSRLNQSVSLAKDNCSEDEFITYRTAIGKIMGCMLLDVMNPIFEQYPELKPPSLE